MEMEMEVQDEMNAAAVDATGELMERLVVAADLLEQAVARIAAREIDLEASLGRLSPRETELERLLAEAEGTIASLKAGRKTAPAGVATLLAKEGPAGDAGGVDAALVSLSVEQRIAVKAGLMRAGMLG